nr:MAG TPA: hypothetical protein [Caudoviricetes sp.]
MLVPESVVTYLCGKYKNVMKLYNEKYNNR